MGVNELILYIRENFEKKYAENIANGLYDERDLNRLKNDNTFVRTYIRGRERLDEGVDLVHSSFKFKKENKVNDLTEESFDRELWDLGIIYFHSKDINGHRLLWIRVKLHRKDAPPDRLQIEKMGFIYALEKALNEAPLSKIVVCLDMTSCGLANMDIEFVKFIITCFKFYYPTFLEYMLIYDMPWIFNAAWKVIKAWLSTEAASKIKFVTKADVQTYIAPENLPEHMGGTDQFKFEYTPGMASQPLYPEDEEDKKLPKKVTFMEANCASSALLTPDSPLPAIDINANSSAAASPRLRLHSDANNSANDKLSNKLTRSSSLTPSSTFVGRFLTVSPADELLFDVGGDGDAFDVITLSNTLPFPVAFKVKTTSPEKYRVRPSSGHVKPGKSDEVYVYLMQDQYESVNKDKFLILAMEVAGKDLSDLSKLWKEVPKDSIMEHKLKCSIHKKETPDKPFKAQTGKISSSFEDKINRLEQQNRQIQRQLNILMGIQIAFAITFFFLLISYSCFGEDLFTYYLALPFSFCGDKYGRQCK